MNFVVLKFVGLGLGDCAQATIKIYDTSFNLIYDGNTNNGKLSLYLEYDKCYKLEAYSLGRQINIWFYVSRTICSYIFNFNVNQDNNITFVLTDYYYNLPIEKGELILWQK